MHKGYKYRLRPTVKQAKKLTDWVGACRFIYNVGLEHRQINYVQNKRSVNYSEQQDALPEAKRLDGFEWLKEVPSQSLQFSLRNLDTAYKNFYKGIAKFPQFKRKGKTNEAFCNKHY